MENTTRISPSTMLGAKSHSPATLAIGVLDLHGASVENIRAECSGPTHLLFASVSIMIAIMTILSPINFIYFMHYYIIIAIAQCGNLGHPLYGNVKVSGYTHGSSAFYTCNSGYRLIGNSYRRCYNGQWNLKEPVCESMSN